MLVFLSYLRKNDTIAVYISCLVHTVMPE